MKLLLTLTLSLFGYSSIMFGQLNLKISLDEKWDSSKIMIFYSDGANKKFFNPKFIRKEVYIVETIQSRFARLGIFYPNKFGLLQGTSFFIDRKPSYIRLNAVDDSVVDKMSNYETNLENVKTAKVLNGLRVFTKQELQAYNKVYEIYNKLPNKDNTFKLNKADEILKLKELAFIKKNGSEYFYFEKFIQEIVPALMKDHLLELYECLNTNFPKKFTSSYEGQSAKTLLEGNLTVKIGQQCPIFKTTDYLGNEISTEKLKGKYYLLSFWATWCSPCLKEIPQLKDIRNHYGSNELEMISISRDMDSSKFSKGINDLKMNWTHVFNRPIMENLFGEKPIPSLYLIDKNGKIIFSSWEKNIDELEAILSTELNIYHKHENSVK